MNFYDFLFTSKTRDPKRFSSLTETEIHRIEKELRLENKLDSTSGSEALLNFIKALQEHPSGLDFLIANSNLAQAIFLEKPRFKKSERMQLGAYQKTDMQRFFDHILHTELENAIGEATAKNQYARLAHIAKFNRYFPEVITLLLKSKASDMLMLIEARVHGGVMGVYRELEAIKPILIFLGDQHLIQKEKTIQNIVISNSLKDAGQPGIVSFFSMLGDFFVAVGTQPKNLIEKEKKKETLRGCGGVFMLVVGIFLGCLLFLKMCLPEPPVKMTSKEYPANDRRSDKFPTYLTDFERPDIIEYQYLGPRYGRGNPLDKQFGSYPKEMTLEQGPSITNKSSYDVIIFSNENQFTTENAPSAAATYIASDKRGHSGAFYINRLYFGDSLSLFNTHYDTIPVTTKRFLSQPPFSREAIAYRIHFRGRSPITIRDTLDRIFLDGIGSINLYDRDSIQKIEKLPFIFPPL